MAARTAASLTVRPLTPAALTAAKGAWPGRRAIRPSQIEAGPERRRLDLAMRDGSTHAVEAFRLDAMNCGTRREIMESQRYPADEAASADRAEHQVRLGVLRGKLVQRLQPGAALAGHDLRVVERMEQGKALLGGDLAGALGRNLLAGACSVVGQHDGRAVAGGGIALGGGRVDRHDDGDGNAERLACSGQPLREIARGKGDDAAFCLVLRKLLQPPVGAPHLEGAGPLQRLRP